MGTKSKSEVVGHTRNRLALLQEWVHFASLVLLHTAT